MNNNMHFSDGYKVIFEAKKDPASVQLFECDGTYYVMTEDVEDYMCASMNTEISDAIADIAKANGVDSQTICCVGSFDEDFLPEVDDDEDSIPDEDEEDDILEPSEEEIEESAENLDEAYEMLLEKSVEDGAMTLKQAEKCYNKILKTCKSEAETEKQLDECIKTLNKCIDNMKAEKKKVEDGMKSKDQIKYSLKALIPFNSVYRMIKRNDWNIAGIAGDIANLFGAGRFLYITKKKL